MRRIITGLCAFLVLAIAVGVFVGWLRWHRLEVWKERGREVVRAQIDACRSAYQNGGIAALNQYVSGEPAAERDSSFVEVCGTDKTVDFLQVPNDEQDKRMISFLARQPNAAEWMNLPSSTRKHIWTIGRTVLPDGKILYVGRLRFHGRHVASL